MSECHRYPKPTVVRKDLSYSVALLSACQYLVVFQFMALQVVQVERAPVTTHDMYYVLGGQRVT